MDLIGKPLFYDASVRAIEESGVTVIPDYELLREGKVGEGGFGALLVGRLRKDRSRRVVIKQMLTRYNLHHRKLFAKEIKFLGTVNHPNIVGMLGVSLEPLEAILEYVEFDLNLLDLGNYRWKGIVPKGHNLAELLSILDKYDLVEIAALDIGLMNKSALDVARGLAYLHAHDICHRDLKPQNILVANHGRTLICKLTDFGEARSPDIQTATPTGKTTNLKRGTYVFFSPEQCFGLHDDAGFEELKRIDVWGFGMILFCLLNPNVPHPWWDLKLDNPMLPLLGITAEMNARRLPRGSSKYQHLQDKRGVVKDIFERCCNYTPEDRPHMDQVVEELQEIYTYFLTEHSINPATWTDDAQDTNGVGTYTRLQSQPGADEQPYLTADEADMFASARNTIQKNVSSGRSDSSSVHSDVHTVGTEDLDAENRQYVSQASIVFMMESSKVADSDVESVKSGDSEEQDSVLLTAVQRQQEPKEVAKKVTEDVDDKATDKSRRWYRPKRPALLRDTELKETGQSAFAGSLDVPGKHNDLLRPKGHAAVRAEERQSKGMSMGDDDVFAEAVVRFTEPERQRPGHEQEEKVAPTPTENKPDHKLESPYTSLKVKSEMGGWGEPPNRFRIPRGVAITGDVVMVTDSGNGRVAALRRSAPKNKFRTFCEHDVDNPYDVLVDSAGDVYVTCMEDTEIKVLEFDGESLVYQRTIQGGTDWQEPRGFALDGDDVHLYVACQAGVHKISKHNGVISHTLQEPDGVKTRPWGIAKLGEVLLVSYPEEQKLFLYTQDSAQGQALSLRGQKRPRGVSEDGMRFLVADYGAECVFVVSSDGVMVGKMRLSKTWPQAVAPSAGSLLVLDAKGHRVIVMEQI